MINENDNIFWNGIYLIRNKINNHCYVGQTWRKNGFHARWREHKSALNSQKHHNSYLQNAWNKYGKDNFEFSILEIVDDYLLITSWEEVYFKIYGEGDLRKKPEYNIKPAGPLNRELLFGEDGRRKLSAKHKLRMANPEIRQIYSERWTVEMRAGAVQRGKERMTDEMKALISEKTKEAMTPELRESYKVAHSLAVSSPEHRKSISEKATKRFSDPKERFKRAKPVKSINDITGEVKEYPGLRDAARQTKISSGSIWRAIRHCLTAGGLRWQFSQIELNLPFIEKQALKTRKPWSEASKLKASVAALKRSSAAKSKICKPIKSINLTTEKVVEYESITAASIATKVHKTTICYALKHQSINNNKLWKYL